MIRIRFFRAGRINSEWGSARTVQILVQGLFLFLNRVPSFFPLVHFGQSKPEGHSGLDTVDSDLMHHQFRLPFFNGIQARRAEILLTLSLLTAVSFMQLFFKKPAITFRTSLSSSLCALATRTSLSCSTRTLLSLTLQFSHSRSTLRAKVLGV